MKGTRQGGWVFPRGVHQPLPSWPDLGDARLTRVRLEPAPGYMPIKSARSIRLLTMRTEAMSIMRPSYCTAPRPWASAAS